MAEQPVLVRETSFDDRLDPAGEDHDKSDETATRDMNLPMQRTNEEDSDLEYSVFEVLEYHESDEDAAASKNRDFFTRLWTGNVLFSGTKGAVRIIKYFAGGAQNIGHKFVQAICQESSGTAELPETITETCQLILDTVRKYNGSHNTNNILVQEKWLDETEYLLKNKVLTIGVFGRHKAGKSTLLNALLHHEVLPATSRNETAFILRICHKASNHYGSSCFEDTEQFLSAKEEEVKGSHDIQKAIHNKNSQIRNLESTATMDIDKLVAHVPFLCRCSTGDINIVLLDTPGLSESNELGISEVSEYRLMTCSVYIYVMSCQQLEDSIDTDSLRAIVKRDPNVFKEKRILIAVTKLDEYEMPDARFNDSSDSSDNDESLAKHVDSIKKIIQDQCKGFVFIPDECIIPLCATGALEARKEKLGGKRNKEMKVLMVKLDVSTAEEIEKVSQVISLEEKLIEIASRCHYLWHYNIVRDCIRYLDQAMRKLDENKKEFIKLEKEFNERVEEKEGFMEHFKTVVKKLRAKYANGSEFCSKLEDSYDKDLETNKEKTENVFQSHLEIFKKFRTDLERRGSITTEQFNSEAGQLIEKENELLKKDLKDLPFRKMDLVVKESAHEFGSTRQKLKQYLASYCNTTTSTSDESHLPEDCIIPEYVNDGKIPVSNPPPLKLSDLLEQSKVHYTIWDTIVVYIKKLFIPLDDPERQLRNAEIDAFLMELEKDFITGCLNFFKDIKPKIVEGYLKQHQEIAERHIADVERLYFEQREAMDTQVKKWRKQAKFNKEMVQYHSELCENMKKQRAHLLSLADRFGISLCSKDSQDE